MSTSTTGNKHKRLWGNPSPVAIYSRVKLVDSIDSLRPSALFSVTPLLFIIWVWICPPQDSSSTLPFWSLIRLIPIRDESAFTSVSVMVIKNPCDVPTRQPNNCPAHKSGQSSAQLAAVRGLWSNNKRANHWDLKHRYTFKCYTWTPHNLLLGNRREGQLWTSRAFRAININEILETTWTKRITKRSQRIYKRSTRCKKKKPTAMTFHSLYRRTTYAESGRLFFGVKALVDLSSTE